MSYCKFVSSFQLNFAGNPDYCVQPISYKHFSRVACSYIYIYSVLLLCICNSFWVYCKGPCKYVSIHLTYLPIVLLCMGFIKLFYKIYVVIAFAHTQNCPLLFIPAGTKEGEGDENGCPWDVNLKLSSCSTRVLRIVYTREIWKDCHTVSILSLYVGQLCQICWRLLCWFSLFRC